MDNIYTQKKNYADYQRHYSLVLEQNSPKNTQYRKDIDYIKNVGAESEPIKTNMQASSINKQTSLTGALVELELCTVMERIIFTLRFRIMYISKGITPCPRTK
jgi:hypothetical protein